MKAAVGEPAVNRKREDHPIARKKQAYSPLRSLLTSSFHPFQRTINIIIRISINKKKEEFRIRWTTRATVASHKLALS